jgi:hypothetical protein
MVVPNRTLLAHSSSSVSFALGRHDRATTIQCFHSSRAAIRYR